MGVNFFIDTVSILDILMILGKIVHEVEKAYKNHKSACHVFVLVISFDSIW